MGNESVLADDCLGKGIEGGVEDSNTPRFTLYDVGHSETTTSEQTADREYQGISDRPRNPLATVRVKTF